MISFSVGFFLGILGTFQLETLPDVPLWWLVCFLGMHALGLVFFPKLRFVFAVLLGSTWLMIDAHFSLAQRVPPAWENKVLSIEGYIRSLPQIRQNSYDDGNYQTFDFTVTRLFHAEQVFWSSPTKIRLSWSNPPSLEAGQQWQLQVRLKSPHGVANQHGFDWQRWLISQNIRATGKVNPNGYRRIALDLSLWQTLVYQFHKQVQMGRAYLGGQIQQQLAEHPQQAFIQALVIGNKTAINPAQWEILRDTGTMHLMVISGLHIGLAALFGMWLGRMIWWLCSPLLWSVPNIYFSVFFAALVALLYALLAGFSLPTQRALLMLGFFLWGVLRYKKQTVAYTLSVTALCLMILQPFALLSSSFYLTFFAVGVILYAMNGKPIVFHAEQKTPLAYALMKLRQYTNSPLMWLHKYPVLLDNPIAHRLNAFFSGTWLRVYWVMFIGFMPIVFIFFHQLPTLSFFLNLIAVPVVSLIVVPVALLGAGLFTISAEMAGDLLSFAADQLDWLWAVLASNAQCPFAVWQHHFVPWYWSAVAFVGLLMLWLPRRFPLRWLGLVLLLPWLSFKLETPPPNSVWMDVLDVGQGLSILVRTQNHTLLYDTGKGNAEYSQAKQTVLPLLQAKGVQKLDLLLISHGDNDHSGGVAHIRARYPDTPIISSVAERYSNAQACQLQSWRWDGVLFELLHPTKDLDYMRNDSSCVLKISHPQGSLLLSADIEKPAEYFILQEHRDMDVSADVLVVPHHGSESSSSKKWVRRVNPHYAIFTAAYLNQWHFPHAITVERYQQQGATLLNTAISGQISVRIDDQGVHPPILYREQERYFWQ